MKGVVGRRARALGLLVGGAALIATGTCYFPLYSTCEGTCSPDGPMTRCEQPCAAAQPGQTGVTEIGTEPVEHRCYTFTSGGGPDPSFVQAPCDWYNPSYRRIGGCTLPNGNCCYRHKDQVPSPPGVVWMYAPLCGGDVCWTPEDEQPNEP